MHTHRRIHTRNAKVCSSTFDAPSHSLCVSNSVYECIVSVLEHPNRMSRWECRVRYRYINVYWKIDWYCMPYICHDTTNLCVGWWDRGVDVQSIEWIRIEPVAMRRHTLTQSHPQQKSVLCVHFIWFHFFFNFNIHTILAWIYWHQQMCFTRLYCVFVLCLAFILFSTLNFTSTTIRHLNPKHFDCATEKVLSRNVRLQMIFYIGF